MIITRSDIENRVLRILQRAGYENLLYRGCFDILAKNDRFFAIKTLKNVDALSKETAANLKIFSHFFSASALMVSIRSNHNKLQENVIYSRFDIPTVTPELFESLVENGWLPSIFSIKGKHTVTIDGGLLRKVRTESGLSLESLSDKISVSKKSLYEIENERVKPKLETVQKLEDFFDVGLIKPYEIEPARVIENIKPKTYLQRKISEKFNEFKIDHSCMTSSTFEMVGRKKKPILTSMTEDDVNFELKTEKLSQLLSFTDTLGFFILKRTQQENIHGIPVLINSEIDDLESYRDFHRLIRERS